MCAKQNWDFSSRGALGTPGIAQQDLTENGQGRRGLVKVLVKCPIKDFLGNFAKIAEGPGNLLVHQRSCNLHRLVSLHPLAVMDAEYSRGMLELTTATVWVNCWVSPIQKVLGPQPTQQVSPQHSLQQ